MTDCADNGGAGQLRARLTAAQSTGGGTITFGCGPGTIVLQSGTPLPTITTNTTIEGGGNITISGNNATRIFNVSAGGTLTLNSITVRDGYAAADGGALRSEGTLNVNGCKFLYNATAATASGSAILCLGPTNITNTEFAHNTGGGGALKPRSANAVTHVSGSTFHDNKSTASSGGGFGGAMQLHDAPSVTVDGCNFYNNEAGTRGGAIQVGSTSVLTLKNSSVTGNSALNPAGGGLDVGGRAVITNCEIRNNIAAVGGAGINAEAGAEVEIVGSTIAENTALVYAIHPYPNKVFGGGIRSLGRLTISSSTIRSNRANVAQTGAVGGGIYHETGSLSLDNVTLESNETIHGGGIYMASGTATMNNVTFAANRGTLANGSGAGLNIDGGTATITNATFINNLALAGGAGIYNRGNLTILNSSFSGNNATFNGGGISNSGTMILTSTLVSGNKAQGSGTGSGGGISNGGTLTLNLVTVSGNLAHFDGGGIANGGSLTLNNSLVMNNTANGGDDLGQRPYGGGGIYNSNSLTLNRSTVSGNKTNQRDGGGMYNRGIAFVANSTFSGNSAPSWGGGLISDHAQTILNHVTISGNSAAAGGGIYHLTADINRTLVMQNTLIANNTPGYNCAQFAGSQDVKSLGYNVSDDNSFVTFCPVQGQPGDLNNASVNLAPLGNYGGDTPTQRPQPGSAAIDVIPSGKNGCNTMANPDQRGVSRPQGASCDAGAVEVAPSDTATPTPTPAPTPTPTPTATPLPTRFANISTRLRVETGDNVLIGGFIVTGAMQKRIIVRALGPSLPGEVGPLANPLLELYNGSGELLESNDNWQEAPNGQEIIDSTIPPPNELESAILRNVEPGAYTAVVRDVAGGEGVGLVEVYDLGSAQDSKLANISTRGRVLTGDNVMIGGLIVTGSGAQRAILRAIGPSLGLAGQLEDPLLELFDGNGNPISSNNDWKDSQQAEIEATTIPPSNELESAIVTSLVPGAYTAIVRGVNDTTGIALVEVYALQ